MHTTSTVMVSATTVASFVSSTTTTTKKKNKKNKKTMTSQIFRESNFYVSKLPGMTLQVGLNRGALYLKNTEHQHTVATD